MGPDPQRPSPAALEPPDPPWSAPPSTWVRTGLLLLLPISAKSPSQPGPPRRPAGGRRPLRGCGAGAARWILPGGGTRRAPRVHPHCPPGGVGRGFPGGASDGLGGGHGSGGPGWGFLGCFLGLWDPRPRSLGVGGPGEGFPAVFMVSMVPAMGPTFRTKLLVAIQYLYNDNDMITMI